jgi:peptidoglycan/LPS O-acetylase OafA/YrhL
MWTICRMDALAVGAAVAVILRMPIGAELVRRHRQIGWGAIALALAGFLVTRGDPRTTGRSQTIGYSILAISFAVLVFAAFVVEVRKQGLLYRVLAWRPLRLLGIYSYGIYVFHLPIHRAIGIPVLRHWVDEKDPVGAKIGILYLLATGAVSFLAAMASYHLLEKRFLALKRYFTPSRTKPGGGG